MRVMALVLSVLASSAVMACPDLTGTYSCMGDEAYDVAVEQSVVDGITVYHFMETDSEGTAVYDVIADNMRREYKEEDVEAWTQSFCQGNILVTDFGSVEKSSNMNIVGRLMTKVDEQTNLARRITGRIQYNGETLPYDQSEVCRRK